MGHKGLLCKELNQAGIRPATRRGCRQEPDASGLSRPAPPPCGKTATSPHCPYGLPLLSFHYFCCFLLSWPHLSPRLQNAPGCPSFSLYHTCPFSGQCLFKHLHSSSVILQASPPPGSPLWPFQLGLRFPSSGLPSTQDSLLITALSPH